MSNLMFSKALRELEGNRVKILLRAVVYFTIIAGTAVVCYQVFHPPLFIVLFATLFIVTIVYAVTIGTDYGDYVTMYKNQLVKAWFAETTKNLTYDKASGANYVEFEFSGFLYNVIKSMECYECIYGKLRDYPIACSTISIGIEVNKTNPGESKMAHSREFHSGFNGIFIIAGERDEIVDIAAILAEVVVAPKGLLHLEELVLAVSSTSEGTLSHYKKDWTEKKVQIAYPESSYRFYPETWSYTQSWNLSDKHITGNNDFDAIFDVYAKDNELMLQYVTGEVQKKLITAKEEWGNDVLFSFGKKRCYSAFALKKNILQPPVFRSLNAEEGKKLANEYQKIMFAMEATAEIMNMVHCRNSSG